VSRSHRRGGPCTISQSGARSGSPKKTSSATTEDTSCAFHIFGLKRILSDPPRRSPKSSGGSWRLPQDPWRLEPPKPSWTWRILPEAGASHRAKTPTQVLQRQHSGSSPEDAGRRVSLLIPVILSSIIVISPFSETSPPQSIYHML